MTLQEELGLLNAIQRSSHEVVLSIVLSGSMLTKEGDRILRPLGLTDSQFNVLMLLKYQTESGSLNQTRLGNMLLVNRSNVTGLIDRMEQAGWVVRESEKRDRRVKQVRLTKAGRQLLDRAEQVYFERVEEIMSAFNRTEQRQLVKMLETIRQRMGVAVRGKGV